jgi:LuxR family maltose regulon positive regulatory protein
MADYLRSEVLARLPQVTATFLVRTSVLDQLCGPLCDAVLGTAGSRQVLESLERSNLLLIPLDRRREWYRYHHLLRDLLRAELTRSAPEHVTRLHDRAAAWFEANGRADLAIDHALAAGDADRAARLVAGNAQLTYAAGRADTTVRWLAWFDERGLLEQYPQVAVVGAATQALLGHFATAERWANAAAEGAGSLEATMPDGSSIDTWVALLESALCRRGVARMRADATSASSQLAPGSPWEGPGLFMIAMSDLLGGSADPDLVEQILARSTEVCLQTRVMPTAAAALAERSAVAIERHDWDGAARFAAEAVRVVRDGDLDGYMYSIVVEAVAARVAAHRGDLAQAKEHVVRASRLRPLCSAAAPFCTHFLLQLARAYLELADPAGARAVLRQVRDILYVRPDLGAVPTQADELHHMIDTIRLGPVGASSLTAAELRLLPMLATHLSYAEIGDRLIVSRNTVKTHAVSIFRKLGVSSRSEAVEVAEQVGLFGR